MILNFETAKAVHDAKLALQKVNIRRISIDISRDLQVIINERVEVINYHMTTEDPIDREIYNYYESFVKAYNLE